MKNYKNFIFFIVILILEFGILNIAQTACLEKNAKGDCISWNTTMGFETPPPEKLPTGEISQELIDRLREQPQENTEGLDYTKSPGEDRVYVKDTTTKNAEQKGLVPCGPVINEKGKDIGTPCKFCDLTKLVERVINFALYKVAIPLVVIFIVWGGLTIMTAGDSTEKVSQGRKIIQSAIIGVFIALGAWMIINMILSAIGGGSFAPWKFGDYSFCTK